MEERNGRRWFRLLICPAFLGGLWTLFMLGLFVWSVEREREQVFRMAEHQARLFLQEIVPVRAWSSMHEEEYGHVTEVGQSDYLLKGQDRGIRTEQGRLLTGIDSAAMTRQLFTIAKDHGGVRFRITGLTPIRPENLPDPWEKKNLKAFDAGRLEGGGEMTASPTGEVFRYIAPLETEKRCLTCHGRQSKQVPPVMGGISVVFSAVPLQASLRRTVSGIHAAFTVIWLAGLFGIGFSSRMIRSRTRQVETSNQGTSLLMSGMCHDLHTPLRGIQEVAGRIRKRDLPEECQVQVELIKSSVRSLLEVVSRIKEEPCSEHGRLSLRPHAFFLRSMLREALEIFGVEAERKGLSFSWHVEADVPDPLFGDDFRLRQVLGNLVGNAVGNTNAGSIRVHVRRNRCSNRREQVCLEISVAEIGPEMPESVKETILQNPRRGDFFPVERLQGPGERLTVCRQLVEMMGGRITVLKNGSGGTVCNVNVTVVLNEAVRANVREASGTGNTGRSRERGPQERLVPKAAPQSILVAESTPRARRFFQKVLEEAGHEVTMVDSGEDVLKALRTGKFDMVFMDVRMEGGDGLETVRCIRNETRPWFPVSIPIIVLTSMALPEDRQRCLAAGVTGCLVKPVTGADLLISVAHQAGLTCRESGSDDAASR